MNTKIGNEGLLKLCETLLSANELHQYYLFIRNIKYV